MDKDWDELDSDNLSLTSDVSIFSALKEEEQTIKYIKLQIQQINLVSFQYQIEYDETNVEKQTMKQVKSLERQIQDYFWFLNQLTTKSPGFVIPAPFFQETGNTKQDLNAKKVSITYSLNYLMQHKQLSQSKLLNKFLTLDQVEFLKYKKISEEAFSKFNKGPSYVEQAYSFVSTMISNFYTKQFQQVDNQENSNKNDEFSELIQELEKQKSKLQNLKTQIYTISAIKEKQIANIESLGQLQEQIKVQNVQEKYELTKQMQQFCEQMNQIKTIQENHVQNKIFLDVLCPLENYIQHMNMCMKNFNLRFAIEQEISQRAYEIVKKSDDKELNEILIYLQEKKKLLLKHLKEDVPQFLTYISSELSKVIQLFNQSQIEHMSNIQKLELIVDIK